MAIGRITGPLLKSNLLRNGIDLAFETNLLYLDVVNGKVGIKTIPNVDYDLDVNGTTRTTYLNVDTQAIIASFTLSGNTIASSNSQISLAPATGSPVVYQAKLVLDDLQISTNTIEITAADTDLEFKTLGTGKVIVNSDMEVNGNIYAYGNITTLGTINLGNENTDNVIFNADIQSDVIPNATDTYNLGTNVPELPLYPNGKRWANVYATGVTTDSLTITDLTVNNTLDVAGTATFNGDTTLGTDSSNTVTITGTISSNIVPTTNAFYDLGTSLLPWNNGYFSRIEVDTLVIDNNTIATTANSDNLILSANGAGIISIPTNDVQIDQALTVNGDTALKGTTINGDVSHTGNVTQTGDYTQTGDTTITGDLTVSTFGQFEKIRIDSNTISTTATDTNLLLEANGTGIISIPTNDVEITQDLTVNGIATIQDLSVTNSITANSFSTGDILIDDNYITTQLTDHNLILSANGTGIVSIPTNDVQIDQALTVNGDTSLKGTTINGDVGHTGNVTQTGDYTQTGDTTITGNLTVSTFGQFEKIRIDSNTISTTATDTNLLLEANGIGIISIPTNDVEITQDLTVNGTATINELQVTTALTAGSLSDGDILIQNNEITTTLLNHNLILNANGAGIISIPSNDVQIDQALTVNGNTSLKGTTINGDITHVGNVTQTGNFIQTGDTTITGDLTVTTFGQFEKIRIDGETISTSAANTDLILEANGIGIISIPTNDVEITQNLTVDGTATINELQVTTTITANALSDGDILIQNNEITTTLLNHNLILNANGAGIISIPTNDVQIDQALTVNGDTALKGTTINGDVGHTGNVTQTGDYTQTGDTTITGDLTVSTFGQFEKIRIDSNTISTTATDTNLLLEANGIGIISIPTNDVEITQNLTVDGTATINELQVTTTLTANALSTGDILIDDNYITTQLTDHNLILSANGTGIVSIPTNDVQIDQALTVNGDTSLKGTTINGDVGHTGNVTQTGDYTQTGDTTITGNLTVSTFGQFEKIRIDSNTISTTATDTNLLLEANGTGIISIPTNDVEITQDLTVNGTATINELQVTTTLTAGAVSDGDILIQNNEITTTLLNHNLILNANGAGIISIPTNDVQIDQALTVNGDTSLKGTTINGDVGHTGNVTQTGDYTQTGDTTITGDLTVTTFGQFEKIRIDGDTISTSAANTDLILEANGTGIISIPTNDVEITQDLTVNGHVNADSLDVTTTITAGSFSDGDILIQNNEITTQLTNHNLVLTANGTGIISIPSNDVELGASLTVTQNLTVTTGTTYLKDVDITGDITQTGDLNQTGDFTTSGSVDVTGNITGHGELILPEITISGNIITTTTTNTDLDLRANGAGDVIFEELKVSNNNIQSTVTNSNITLTPQGSGTVVVNSTQSIVIPVGTDADRPASPTNGMIRYNTTRNRYEGYNAAYSKWLQLSGVEDYDGNTKILAEATPGANDNTIYFYANGNLTTTIDSTKLATQSFQTTQIDITNNTISAINPDTDIDFTTSGTGRVKIGNFKISQSTITNTVSGAVTEFAETGTGYVKIAGTIGVVIPSGDNNGRPLSPVLGMMRFNTFYSIIEIWDGTDWINIAGTSSGINITQATELGIVSALIYG